ncbi:carotenoid 1,2-hydratase [Maribius pontilimi]|uniref:Carotenoid 1,2-hydratase n=1 Tax=Palleronia pontilimi TaxID=1964209 RepID=A0A934IDE8_9RHOB|nr:carotenoid 1,2-hydratase [Palleronia pontilimi]
MSDNGRHAVSVIGFIGSVFSPWYRWSGRRAPDNHVCINVATYGPGGRFTMTDRGRDALRQTPSQFTVGPSSMRWQDGKLVIHVDEVSSLPLVSRVRGTITLTPDAVTGVEVALTPDGAHVWRPFAPSARIDVDLGRRGHWSGHGYFDANFGTRALEADFSYWTWGRYPLKDGAALFYDAVLRDGSGTGTALRMDGDGQVAPMQAPPKARLKRSLWAVRRETRADAGHAPKQEMSMLDAPFYTRTAVSTRIEGEPTTGVHEALDLDRFRGPWLMPMLAVRVPRRPGWRF